MIHWECSAPRSSRASIEYVDAFDARGMRRVYGRGDTFGHKAAYNLDVWLDRKGRLLARFWSRNQEVDTFSIEIHGISPQSIPRRSPDTAFSDAWIPKVLRDKYEDWIISEC